MPFFGLPTLDDFAADGQIVLAELPRFVGGQAIAKGEEYEFRARRSARGAEDLLGGAYRCLALAGVRGRRVFQYREVVDGRTTHRVNAPADECRRAYTGQEDEH